MAKSSSKKSSVKVRRVRVVRKKPSSKKVSKKTATKTKSRGHKAKKGRKGGDIFNVFKNQGSVEKDIKKAQKTYIQTKKRVIELGNQNIELSNKIKAKSGGVAPVVAAIGAQAASDVVKPITDAGVAVVDKAVQETQNIVSKAIDGAISAIGNLPNFLKGRHDRYNMLKKKRSEILGATVALLKEIPKLAGIRHKLVKQAKKLSIAV
jgi:hypothetical protein